jgi:lipopolysaccharide export system protein LptA
MRVRAREIQAFLKPAETTETAGNAKDAKNVKVANDGKKSSDDSGSSLDHALADGAVEIVQTGSGRTRTGTSEHAEYYAEEGRLVLEKGQPRMADSSQGTTQGRQLTWFSNDDRLLINGAAAKPSKSLLIRK